MYHCLCLVHCRHKFDLKRIGVYSIHKVFQKLHISVMESKGIWKRNNIKHNIHIINQQLSHNFRESWNIALTSCTRNSSQLCVIQNCPLTNTLLKITWAGGWGVNWSELIKDRVHCRLLWWWCLRTFWFLGIFRTI